MSKNKKSKPSKLDLFNYLGIRITLFLISWKAVTLLLGKPFVVGDPEGIFVVLFFTLICVKILVAQTDSLSILKIIKCIIVSIKNKFFPGKRKYRERHADLRKDNEWSDYKLFELDDGDVAGEKKPPVENTAKVDKDKAKAKVERYAYAEAEAENNKGRAVKTTEKAEPMFNKSRSSSSITSNKKEKDKKE